MEKFVRYNDMSFEAILSYMRCLFYHVLLSGCASVQMSGYISRVDHPYERKYYAGFEKVVSAFIYVLKNQAGSLSEADPAIYERDDRYDNNGYQNLLIITDIRKKFLHLTSHAFKYIYPFDRQYLRRGNPL